MKIITLLFTILTILSIVKSQPEWWNDRVEQGHLLSTNVEPNQDIMSSVGNGYAAYVIGGPIIYVGGVFNGPQQSLTNPSHRAAIPNYQTIILGSGATIEYAGLDMENGTYTRQYSFSNTLNTFATQTYYAYYPIKNILIQEIEIDNNDNGPFVLELSTIGGLNQSIDMTISLTSTSDLVDTYVATILQPELSGGIMTSVAITTTHVPSSITIAPNTKQTLYFVTCLVTNLETESYVQSSLTIYKESMLELDVALDQHIQAWNQIWSARIEIGGNLELAQIINSSLYYILSSVRSDWPFSLSPGGLASNGYHGHVFWDAETWMYPPLLVLYPELAVNGVLQYRVNNLEGATQKAESYGKGWTGYMFPWESAFSGEEVCPTVAPTGLLEQHITGDISFAFRQYYYATGDMDWLVNTGYKVIKGMAEFWASRVQPQFINSTTEEVYSIQCIIPPDEYAVCVNNSVYTNIIASYALQWGVEAANLVGDTDVPSSQWLTIANNLIVLFNESAQMHPEYDGYFGEQIKQADVILLGYPLMYNMSTTVRENDLVYYETKTNPDGPAMTHAMFTIGWLELNNTVKAADEWSLAYANSQQPFGVWTETPTGGTINFITGAGGFLQGVLFGYGGLRITQNYISLSPQIPPSSTSLNIKSLNYQGSTLDVYVDDYVITVTLTSSNSSLQLYIDHSQPLLIDQPITLNPFTTFIISS